MATIDEIKKNAQAVKNATQVGENTASRVGGVLSDIADSFSAYVSINLENAISGRYDAISIDGNTVTIKASGFSVICIGKRIVLSGKEDKVYKGTGVRTSLYINPKYLVGTNNVDFTTNDDVFVLKQDSVYNGILFAQWYQSKLMCTGLIAGCILDNFNQKILSNIKQFTNNYCYFSGPTYPKVSFTVVGNILNITFPKNCEMRLYCADGMSVLKKIGDEELTFSIPAPNKLVYDFSDSTIKVVSDLSYPNHLLLIGMSSIPLSSTSNAYTVGALAHYVNPYMIADKSIDTSKLADGESFKAGLKAFSDVSSFYRDLIPLRNNVRKNSVFSFLFFTDIHGWEKEMQRIVSLANDYGDSYVDAVLNAGDTVASTINEDLTWYNSLVEQTTIPCITAVGNHDCWLNYSSQNLAEPKQTYDKITAHLVEQIDVIQPSDAEKNGYNYYYKDFGNIRVIVLDSTYANGIASYLQAELEWFQNIALADKTKSVVCLVHHPFTDTVAAKNGIMEFYKDSPFNTLVNTGDGAVTKVDFAEVIDQFIDDGGTFIAWICGHVHADMAGVMKSHHNQLVIANNTARGQNVFPFNVDTDREDGTENFDCFDYIGIDTTNHVIKRLRFGASSDVFMRKKKMMCYNYEKHEFVY